MCPTEEAHRPWAQVSARERTAEMRPDRGGVAEAAEQQLAPHRVDERAQTVAAGEPIEIAVAAVEQLVRISAERRAFTREGARDARVLQLDGATRGVDALAVEPP